MSNIDPTFPTHGHATTKSVRDNFAIAASEIDALRLSIDALDKPAAFASPIAAVFCGWPISDGFVTDSVSNSMNVRRGAMAPTGSDLSDIVVGIPGCYFGPQETTIPTPYTVTAASIEYPAGTFQQLFANGSPSLAVIPGRAMSCFDPCPITVLAGDKFWVKLFLTWTPGALKLQRNTNFEIIGNWTNAGTNLADQTQTTTVLPSAPATSLYGNLMVWGRYAAPKSCVGILGDSIMANGLDQPDPVTGAITLGKALRNVIPHINISQSSDSLLGYFERHECRDLYLRDTSGRVLITDMIVTMGRNEMDARLLDNMPKFIRLWRSRGVRVVGWTVTPHTTSTDTWATIANQTVNDPAREVDRVSYNEWLRANYQSLGMVRLIDAARIVDPTDSGKWNVDGTAGSWGYMVPTMNGRSIAAVSRADYNGETALGRDYPASQTVACQVYAMPGDRGAGGAAVSLTFTPEGCMPATATVTAGGDYDYPPMIVVPSQWVGDGLHMATRGYQEVIHKSGLSPEWFA